MTMTDRQIWKHYRVHRRSTAEIARMLGGKAKGIEHEPRVERVIWQCLDEFYYDRKRTQRIQRAST